jgi:hypothetical protein
VNVHGAVRHVWLVADGAKVDSRPAVLGEDVGEGRRGVACGHNRMRAFSDLCSKTTTNCCVRMYRQPHDVC